MIYEPSVGMSVRVTGGKYNGYEGVVAKTCDAFCSIRVNHENKQHELVMETKHITPLANWSEGKTNAELTLRGHGEAV